VGIGGCIGKDPCPALTRSRVSKSIEVGGNPQPYKPIL